MLFSATNISIQSNTKDLARIAIQGKPLEINASELE